MEGNWNSGLGSKSQESLGSRAQVNTIDLTGREQQVLRLILDGLQNKLISLELDISIKTVEYHTSNIFRKLQVKDRFELQYKFQIDEQLF